MWAISIHLAILTGKRISEVIKPFETREEAIAQCLAWTRKVAEIKEEAVVGYEYYAVYGTADDTTRVERHMLELAEPSDADEEGEASLLHLNLCPAALKEVDA